MEPKRLLKVGIAGTVLTAICCFTPLLVWLLAALGLSAAFAWLDYLLLPLLAFFLGLTGAAWLRGKRAAPRARSNG